MTQLPQEKPTQVWEQPPSVPADDLNLLAGNDGLPLDNISKSNQGIALNSNHSSGKNLTHQVIALGAGVVTLGVAAIAGISYSRDSQNSAQSVSVPEQVQPASDESVEKANETARDLANGIIKILAKPGSGAEAYRGDMVGNKTAVIGPDGKYPSADDNKTPESFVGFDPIAGEMYFSSTQGYFPNGVKNDKDFESTSVRITLKVAKDNPIYNTKGQLQLADYEQAMSLPDTLELKSLEAGLHVGVDPAPEVAMTTNDEGKLQATVSEFDQYDDDDSDLSKATEGDEKFDGVSARVRQVAETALEDLQHSSE